MLGLPAATAPEPKGILQRLCVREAAQGAQPSGPQRQSLWILARAGGFVEMQTGETSI